MSTKKSTAKQSGKGLRPRAATVFAAAFIAGAAAAFGVNRALDVHIAQSKPQVESEPIFVAIRSLPQGAAVTVWDVALRDWPKAMMPAAALRPQDSFDGAVLKQPIREGQPLLAFQLVKAPVDGNTQVAGFASGVQPATKTMDVIPQPDLWAPGEQPTPPAAAQTPPAVTGVAPTSGEPTMAVAQPFEPAQLAVEPEVVSVVQPTTETDIEPPLAEPRATSATTAVRYLVVPERIAMQADRSFVTPTATTRQEATLPALQSQPTRQPQTVNEVTPQPAMGQAMKQPPPVLGTPQAIQQRARNSRQPRSMSTQQPAQKRPAASTQRHSSPKPRGNTSSLQTMFPNLSAGMTAVEEQLQKIKRDREAAGETPDEQQPAPRSAARSM